MDTNPTLGQIRAILTALGAALTVWGLHDPSGQAWMPIVGILMAFLSLTWGILHHRDPRKPGRISWSLFRKFLNITGTAAVTYGVMHPERFTSLETLIAALGPILAASFSWIDNSEIKPTDPS